MSQPHENQNGTVYLTVRVRSVSDPIGGVPRVPGSRGNVMRYSPVIRTANEVTRSDQA